MVTHQLKIKPTFLDAIKRGEKTFEVRRDDRGFQKGDVLELCRYLHPEGYVDRNGRIEGSYAYEGMDILKCRVLWVLTGGQFGVEPGYVVMSIEPLENSPLMSPPTWPSRGKLAFRVKTLREAIKLLEDK